MDFRFHDNRVCNKNGSPEDCHFFYKFICFLCDIISVYPSAAVQVWGVDIDISAFSVVSYLHFVTIVKGADDTAVTVGGIIADHQTISGSLYDCRVCFI